MKLPKTPLSRDDIFARLEACRAGDLPWRQGRSWGYVYDAGPATEEISKEAFMSFLSENALDPTVYPSLLRFENDLIAVAVDHLNAPEGAVGSFTSGGTESILLAIKTARDFARATRPAIKKPNMVIPTTAHAAFHKAADYFDVEAITVAVDPQTYKADPQAMRAAITEDTILMAASAPSYAHGVIDPIAELAAIAQEAELLFHVDACIGGWLLPYLRRLGKDIPDFDFAIPGVTSISMDYHKYAYAPKGASVVVYRDAELRRHQIFACARWTGYSVVNPTMQSSKSGGPLAAAWATLNAIGDEGYLAIARTMDEAARLIVEGVNAIDGLEVLGQPEMSLIGISSESLDIFAIIDAMNRRGWYVQAQLGFAGSKPNLHLSIAPSNAPKVSALLEDLAACVEEVRGVEPETLDPGMAAMLGGLDPSQLSPEMMRQMLAAVGIEGASLPERMAPINGLLNALSPELCEKLLAAFFNDLFRPTREAEPALA